MGTAPRRADACVCICVLYRVFACLNLVVEIPPSTEVLSDAWVYSFRSIFPPCSVLWRVDCSLVFGSYAVGLRRGGVVHRWGGPFVSSRGKGYGAGLRGTDLL